MSFDQLSTVLWRERELLETLLYKLEVEELVLSSGRAKWVGHAARDVEALLDRIRSADLGRAVEADAAARDVGLPEGASLAELAAAAPAPWDEMMRGHHAALSEITAQISALGHLNRDLLAQSVLATQEALLGINETVGTYDTRGTTGSSTDAAYLVDRAL